MEYETTKVIAEFEREVEAEMRTLMRAGVPPMNAAERARNIVIRRRSAKTDAGSEYGLGYMQGRGAA